MYRFPWYLTLVSTNHASSNPGLFANVLCHSAKKLNARCACICFVLLAMIQNNGIRIYLVLLVTDQANTV